MKPTRLSLLRAASAMALITSPAVHAAGGLWNVNADGNWNTASNWDPVAVPGTTAGDVVSIQFNIGSAKTVTLNTTSRSVGDLNIGDIGTLFTYNLAASGGAVLNLDGTGTTAATIDFTAAVANNISAPLTLVDNGVIRSNVNAVMTLSGVISGVGKTLTFNNDTNGTVNAAAASQGQFLVSGANTYSGGTTISDCRVQVGTNATALGSGSVAIGSGAQVLCAAALTLANPFSIAGNGWVETATGQPFGALRLDNGARVSGNVTMTANAAIGSNAGAGTVSGIISGGFNLSKRGPGRINLSGTNTYGGLTSVTNGILAATKPAALPGFSTLNGNTVASGTTLGAFVGGAGEFTSADVDTLRANSDFNTGSFLGLDPSNAPGGSFTYGSNITDASGVAGTLGLNKIGSGVLVLSGTNTYTGTSVVSAGALSIATTAALPGYATNGSYTVASGATLAVSNAISDGDVSVMLGTTNFPAGASIGFDTSSGDRTFSGVLADTAQGALGLGKAGANTLTLTGANTYTGPTTVFAGTLIAAGSSAAAGNIVVGNTLANAVLNVPLGGSMTGGTITAGTANGSFGAVNVTGGTLTLATVDASTDSISFGGGEGGYGAFTISDGTFTQQRFMFGGTGSTTNLGGVGVGLITGGTVNSTGWLILSRAGASTGILTITGGLLNHSGASNDLAVGLAGSGRAELNVGGGLLDNTGRRVTFSGGTGGTFHWSGTGLVNLNAGTLLTNSIAYDTTSPFSPNANSYVNFGGGTLKAATSSATFFPAHAPSGTGVSQVYVNGAFGAFTGGATIDTNGFAPTISANFLAPTGNGVTGLTIDNAGSGYVGAPAVKILDGGLPSTATAYAVVGTDAAVPATFGKVTSVVITNPGVIVGTPTVSLVGGGGTGAVISVASTGPNTSGGLTKTGSGQLTLTGNSTYTGLTSVSTGTLAVAGAGTLAGSSGLAVSSGAGFSYLPTVPATTLTLGAGSTLNLANNSTIGGTYGSTIAASGAATVSGTANLALTGTYTSGTSYTVLTAGSGLDSGTYNVLNPSDFTYTLVASPTAVTITPTTAIPLASAHWLGGFAGQPAVWSVSDGSSASNWTTDGAGTATSLVPGSTANVFFSDASANPSNQLGMTLGSNMSIGSLTINSGNPVSLLNADLSVLTIASGLTVSAPAGAVTLNANMAVSNPQTWTNNSANPFITGRVSNGANLLTLSGSGNTTIGNFNGGTGGLTVDSTGFTVLSAATLAGAQTWTNSSVNILTVGAVANAGFAVTLAGTGNFDLGGVVSGSGGLTKAGGGAATLSAANTYTGATIVAEGILTLSGPRTGNSGAITLGTVGLNTTLNISSGTYNMGGNRINVGNSTTAATATVNQTAGAISFTSSDQLLLGLNTFGNQGIYNMSGGSITTAANVARGVMLGVNSNPAPGPASGGGTFNLSGSGVLNMTAASGGGGNAILQIGRSDAIANNTTNVFNQTGGTANVGILGMGGAAAGSAGVSSTLTITAGTFSANSFTILAAGGTNDATINIGGTADVTLPAFPTARGASSTATLNLDGGTLRPSAASATYISGLTDAFIKAGGANFDVPTGRNITVSQSLLTDGVSLGGGLSKSNAGVLTLSGTNTYTGLTTVTGGGLVARNLASLPGIATLHQISLSGSSTLTLGVGGVGEFASTDVDTVLTNADFNTGTALGFDTANAAGGFTYATNISNATGVAGTSLGLTKSGANTLILAGANTYSGPTTITAGILQVGATTNLGDASPTNSINLAGGTFSSGSSAFTLNNSRAVNITAAAGFRSESGGVLTIDTDLANGANNIALTGAGSIIVNGVIGTGVTPTGAITIGGATALPANVTLNGNNLFTGNVTLPAPNTQPFSVLTVTNSGALGVGPKTVASQGGGEIHLQNNITLAANISFNVSGNSSRAVIFNDSGNNTINGNISMNSGNGATIISSDNGLLTLNGNLAATATGRQLQVRGNGNGVVNGVIANGSTVNLPVLKDGGNGTWTFNGANTYSGATTVSAGTLALGNAAALGTGAAVVNGGFLDLGGQTVANAVTVNAAGTLTGSGSAGAATLAGTVTPGGSGSGLITVASATVAATSNLALQLGGTGVRGTNYDAVTVNSALALDGTITVTLNGLVPAATQTFDLIDSTGAINVASFNVNTDLILPALDTGLAWDTSTFATDGQITVVVDLDPFSAWATANSVEGGKGGDEDGDGTTNLMEFATNADPQSGSSGARVYGLVHPIGGTPVLTYTVATRAAAIFAANGSRQEATKDFVKYSIEGTNDLSIWNSVVVTEVTGGDATAVRAAIVPALPTLDSGWEWHTFRTDDNTAVDPTDFIRLNVTEAP